MTVPDPPNKSTKRDIGEAVGQAAVSIVPYAGGPLSVLWVRTVGAAYEKRRQEWEQGVVDAVNDLIGRVDDLEAEDLAGNEQFVDAVANATVAAVATSQQEKLAALRNAVLNSALPSDLDADTQAIFLRNVRDFTPSHLRLLKLLNDPPGWFTEHNIPWPSLLSGSVTDIIETGMPEFAGDGALIGQLDNDLSAAGFTIGGTSGMMSANGLKASRTSARGKAFLRFVSDPRSDTDVSG